MRLGENRKQPQGYLAFIPDFFPPRIGFAFSGELLQKANEATHIIGRLDGITEHLPDVDFFLYMYICKDAASSSQIEGTQATMVDAIEAKSKTSEDLPKDVDDILHYIQAVNYGLKRLKEFPLCLRLIKEIHLELMDGARSSHFADPGNFRKSQNWIGGTSPANALFVPPPVHDMNQALGDLENFFHSKDSLLQIIKAGLIHAQFETIHPFLDGNGRTGRMLITLFLWLEKLLERPVLFLSTYFKKHQRIYYDRLDGYRYGKVEEWLDFFLDGVIEISKEAIESVKQISSLRIQDMKKIQSLGKKTAEHSVEILHHLYKMPIVNVANIQKWTGFTRQGAQKVIDRFIELKILVIKDENKSYGRSYCYKKYLDIFSDS